MTPLELQLDIIKRNCQLLNDEHQKIYALVQESVKYEKYVGLFPECWGTGLNPINSNPTPCRHCYDGKIVRQRAVNQIEGESI